MITPYSMYMRHQSEMEDMIETICENARNGVEHFTLDLLDYYSEDELEYIKQEVKRRMEE